MKTLSEAMLMHGGPLFWVQLLIIFLMIGLAAVKMFQYFSRERIELPSFFRSHHIILFLGIFNLVWAMFAQGLGFVMALNAIIEAADISPELIITGLRNSFISPLIGLGAALLGALFWAILQGRYTKINTMP
jgi:hypothetical protein